MKNARAYIQAGCGVVADSDPTSEYHESLNKARALLRALDEAELMAQATRNTQHTQLTHAETSHTGRHDYVTPAR